MGRPCLGFLQLYTVFVIIAAGIPVGAWASTSYCRQVFNVSKDPRKKDSPSKDEIQRALFQLAQMQLLLDKNQITGDSAESALLSHLVVTREQKMKELVDKLADIMTLAEIREAIRKEVRAIQVTEREYEGRKKGHRSQQEAALTEILVMPQFKPFKKHQNIGVELELVPHRSDNKHEDFLIEYLEDTNSLLTWREHGIVEVLAIDSKVKTQLAGQILTAGLSADKTKLILITPELNLEHYDLLSLRKVSSVPLQISRKPEEYNRETYKLSISPSGKTIAFYR